MSRAPAPVQHTAKQPGPTGPRPAPEAVRTKALQPGSAPSRRPAPLPGHSLSTLPLFAGGAAPGPRAAAPGPQFFDAQAFSPAVARHAVRGATTGRFPFGDRIAAETRGALDPHAVPSVVIDQLPGLGVCQDGKVALRRGSGIDVARHELAHALGGDESTAQAASRDPGVLRSLSAPQSSQAGEPGEPGPTGAPAARRPPVDGWAIGFEFQTHGPNNPKTYEKRIERAPAPDEQQPEQQDEQDDEELLGPDDRVTYRSLNGLNGSQVIYRPRVQDWKMEIDSGDIEIITRAQPETDAGRENLSRQLDEIAAEMQQQAQHGQQAGDPARMKMAEVAAGRLQLDAQIHKDDLGIETGRLQIAMKELGITESDVLTRLGIDQAKVGLHKAELDSSNQKFNTESAMKMRTGQGI